MFIVGEQVVVRRFILSQTEISMSRLGKVGRVVELTPGLRWSVQVEFDRGFRVCFSPAELEKTAAQELIDAYQGR